MSDEPLRRWRTAFVRAPEFGGHDRAPTTSALNVRVNRLAADLVDSNDGARPLVRIASNGDHVPCLVFIGFHEMRRDLSMDTHLLRCSRRGVWGPSGSAAPRVLKFPRI